VRVAEQTIQCVGKRLRGEIIDDRTRAGLKASAVETAERGACAPLEIGKAV